MTPIQEQSLPLILEGKDVIARAKTGSGKTAAFGLGVLQSLTEKQFSVQALILCPTRELSDQVAGEVRRLASSLGNIKVLSLCGGAPFGPQLGSLEHGAHIVVGTPGRIEEHLKKGSLKAEYLRILVLDEADRMLDMGFQEIIDNIIGYLPAKRQNLLFSATFPQEIASIAKRVMRHPVHVHVDDMHDIDTIEQICYALEGMVRNDAVRLLLLHRQPESAIIFCNTKKDCHDLASYLSNKGFSAQALHGDLEQKDRNQILAMFVNKSISLLVATDVAARGLDIEAVELVINYQIARELAVHTHRIGRTGRAGSQGTAATLVDDQDKYKFEQLSQASKRPLTLSPLPDRTNLSNPVYKAPMVTLQIDGGKKQKLRAGDILGALTAKESLKSSEIGKIQITDFRSYVAIKCRAAQTALTLINNGKLKGRVFKARLL